MKRIFNSVLFALLAFTVCGCTGDKGNYDYDEVVRAVITPFPDNIVMEQFQTYRLEPTITFSKTGYAFDDFDYLWTIYQFDPDAGIGTGGIDTLSRERILNVPINQTPEIYILVMKATEKNSKVGYTQQVRVKIVNEEVVGYTLLSDVRGDAEVTFVSYLGNVTKGVFQAVNGHKAGKNPVGLHMTEGFQVGVNKTLSIMCEDEHGGYKVDPWDFSQYLTIADMFIIKPERIKPQKMTVDGLVNFELMINDGVVYNRNIYNKPMSEWEQPHGGDFYLSKFVFSNGASQLLTWDELNRRFQKMNGLQYPDPVALGGTMTQEQLAIFDPNDVDMDMLQGYLCGGTGWYAARNNGRAVMKDDDGKKYLMSFNGANGNCIPQSLIDVSLHPGMTAADVFTITHEGNFAIYNIGTGVGISSFITGLSVRTYEDLIPAGLRIDFMKVDRYRNMNELWLGASDGSGNADSGSFFVFGIASDGSLTEKARYMNICGKVVDIIYKD